jgi:cytochrome c2
MAIPFAPLRLCVRFSLFPMDLSTRALTSILFVSFGINAAIAQDPSGDVSHGKTLFVQNCAVCHADTLGPGNTIITRQGPSLVGVFGRPAGAGPNFNYTNSLKESGFTWDASTLDRFLTNPAAMIPGTTMAMIVANSVDRANVIGYLSSLKAPAEVAVVEKTPVPALRNQRDPGDWRNAAPGVKHHITLADLPPPYSTQSAGNGPNAVRQPANAALSVPPGFTVRLFAAGLSNPRLIRVAPNGDIFVAETARNRIRVLRAADGAWAPSINQIFAERLDQPFGIAFYPSNSGPEWIYVANNNSVVRFRYQNGDLKVRDGGQIVVPRLSESHGGHTTRDIAFSNDDRRMFISVGFRVKRR